VQSFQPYINACYNAFYLPKTLSVAKKNNYKKMFAFMEFAVSASGKKWDGFDQY
jgi:hypothetical protein